jgi:hypothetical protein
MFLSFINFYDNIVKFKNPNYPHDNLSRRVFKKVILFYIFYFFYKPVLKLYGNLIGLIAFYLGLNPKVNVFILKNKNISAEFIARFIAISIKIRTRYFDIIKPIRKNLKKQLYRNFHYVSEDSQYKINTKIDRFMTQKYLYFYIVSFIIAFIKINKFKLYYNNDFLRFLKFSNFNLKNNIIFKELINIIFINEYKDFKKQELEEAIFIDFSELEIKTYDFLKFIKTFYLNFVSINKYKFKKFIYRLNNFKKKAILTRIAIRFLRKFFKKKKKSIKRI